VTTFVAAGRRVLPRGWADLGRQLVIWFGFLVLYQLVRGMADRSPQKAFDSGLWVIHFEQRTTHHLWELTLQRFASSSDFLEVMLSWTYWLSEFAVLGLALLWVYLRRHEHFTRFRNAILLANVIGLVGYALAPTAPPRMFSAFGFADTLDQFGAVNHGSGLVQLAANPYAAMPSIHAADAMIVSAVLAYVCRSWPARILWLLWAPWVWFAVMATGNHFWLDCVAGAGVAAVATVAVYRRPLRRRLAARA
jgi:membrane-associated phospholipid phosphatase